VRQKKSLLPPTLRRSDQKIRYDLDDRFIIENEASFHMA
jgi:hypothetical protein